MTSFDFAYYRPDTLSEAAECYSKLAAMNQAAMYYGGGTELLSMARARSVRFDAVIDYKSIRECNTLAIAASDLVIGSAVTLTAIAESGCFPLLCETVSRIADHTIQDKLTLGGNLAGTIIYREAALPLMITGARARIMTKSGLREAPFSEIFNGRLTLERGELLVQVLIDKSYIELPYNHVKRTKNDKIDYPLITLAANKRGGVLQAAVSGACNMPVLLSSDTLSNALASPEERITELLAQIDSRITGDLHGSREYRKFVLRNLLLQTFENLGQV